MYTKSAHYFDAKLFVLCSTVEVEALVKQLLPISSWLGGGSLRDPFNLRIGGLRTYVAQLGTMLGSKCAHWAQKAPPFLSAPSAVEHQVQILGESLCERLFQTAPRDH